MTLSRLLFAGIVLFWVTMNVLLWRAEFGGDREAGSTVSAEVVWQKILTAPDESTLEIQRSGQRIGYCRWSPSIGGETPASQVLNEDPEGMVRRVTGYTINAEGSFRMREGGVAVRFSSRFTFATNSAWEEFSLHTVMRPHVWDIRASSVKQSLRLKLGEGPGEWSRTFTFDELRDPRRLIEEFAGPQALALFREAGVMGTAPANQTVSVGVEWEAQNDWLKIGHTQARVYRLRARLAGRYEIVVIVSRVGEIMRVELPYGVALVNEALAGL